jgi:hypothetical protein
MKMKIYTEMCKKTVLNEIRKKIEWVMVCSTTGQLNQLVLCQQCSFNLINKMMMEKSLMIRKVAME